MRRTGTITGEGIRLLGPDLQALPDLRAAEDLDDAQRAALERFLGGGDVIAHGGPGSGRTALALTAADASGPGTLLLAPRRAAAGRLRDALAVRGTGEVR
ncbi:MAG: AAA family ATPase, partial [Brachybacterium sp.]|nr:AAA family ATPase [Brachybacterium sp.]